MSPYVIFVIALTIAYIIYYGYHISKDVYGKKNVEESNEETFNIGLEEECVATPVMETGEGFSLGGESSSTPLPEPEEAESEEPNSNIGQKLAEIKGQMQEADVSSTGGLDQFDMAEMMIDCYVGRRNRNGSLKLIRDNV